MGKLAKTKSEYYHNKQSETNSYKKNYSIANGLLLGPHHNSLKDLSGQFADYFIKKIVISRNRLCHSINTDNQCTETDVISILGS